MSNQVTAKTATDRLPVDLKIQARCTAVAAASKLFEGVLPREVGLEEFLAAASEIEEWIKRD